MRYIGFILFRIFVTILSLFPLSILYLFADLFYILLFHIVGYRKKIVYSNLKNSFSQKSEAELNKILKLFYQNLCDIIAENIKTISISKQELLERCTFKNPELTESLYKENKNAIIVIGHYCNWEWAGLSASISSSHLVKAVYKPISNPYFDKFMHELRGRFGMQLIPMQQVYRNVLEHTHKPYLLSFLSDQTPVDIVNCHWMNFMNQDTPIFMGVERIAKKTGHPVIFAKMEKVKRGHYSVEYIPVTYDPKETDEGEITEKHTRLLENSIKVHPELWLWSHRRWKRKRSK